MPKEEICKTCGFDKNLPREPVFITNNSVSFASYMINKCSECGHQKDGSTIIKRGISESDEVYEIRVRRTDILGSSLKKEVMDKLSRMPDGFNYMGNCKIEYGHNPYRILGVSPIEGTIRDYFDKTMNISKLVKDGL